MAKGIDTTVTPAIDALRANAATMGIAATIRAARVTLPYPDVKAAPVRRFVSIACTAEVKHAEADARRPACDLSAGGYFDPRNGCTPADFHMPHETRAGVALVWLTHLQTHDSDRRGPWSRWERWDHASKAEWLQRRRYLVHGLIAAANAYRAARASLA
jgi:hypothetical protein